MSKRKQRWKVIYRSPRIQRFTDDKGVIHNDGYRDCTCDMCEGEKVYGEEKGFPFWIARLLQHWLCLNDDMAFTCLKKVETESDYDEAMIERYEAEQDYKDGTGNHF